jgi:uncharacterized protein YbbC (DUF1343 family)
MPHNRTSATMFRIRPRNRRLLIYVLSLSIVRPIATQAKPSYNASDHTRTGIDVLEQQKFAPLRGKRVGLITNQTGVDFQGRRTTDVLWRAPGVKLEELLSPEHGILGRTDTVVADGSDARTGLPVYSLYGRTRRPTPQMLENLDALVFDIQDVGIRFYTFITTMAYCLEEAAKRHIPFFVLDRPNPLGGDVIAGPMLDRDRTSFVGYFPMPVRYAMTLGELAQMFNAENKIGADLHVIVMKDWHRREIYDQTGLAWIPPSPNLRTLEAAFLYPGIEILQPAGVSVGRGTKAPFELIGAPWIHANELMGVLNRRKIPGVSFTPAQFTPVGDLYSGQLCEGVTINLTDRSSLDSMRMGIEITDALHRLNPEQFQIEKMIDLVGSRVTLERLERGEAPAQIVAGWSEDLRKFRALRKKYLLYD